MYRADGDNSKFNLAALSTFNSNPYGENASKFQQAALNRLRSNSFIIRTSDSAKLWKFTNDFSLYELPFIIQV